MSEEIENSQINVDDSKMEYSQNEENISTTPFVSNPAQTSGNFEIFIDNEDEPQTSSSQKPVSNEILLKRVFQLRKENERYRNISITNQSIIIPKYPILVSDQSPPKILNANNDTTVTVPSNPENATEIETIMETFSANVSIENNANQTSTQSLIETKPITKQPKARTRFSVAHDLPQPLDILEPVDMILMEEARDDFKRRHNINLNKRVIIFKSRFGQPIFYGIEHLNMWRPLGVCILNRPFEMEIYDMSNLELMSFVRQVACIGGCLAVPCFWQTISTYYHHSNINYLGAVKQNLSFCTPKYTVYDHVNLPQFTVQGLVNPAKICQQNTNFLLYNRDLFCVGNVTNNWEDNYDCNFIYRRTIFGIKFPQDIEPRLKILLLSAAILIKYTFYDGQEAVDNINGEEMVEIPLASTNFSEERSMEDLTPILSTTENGVANDPIGDTTTVIDDINKEIVKDLKIDCTKDSCENKNLN